MTGGRMADVELVEEGGAPEPSRLAPRRARRSGHTPRLRRWWPVPVAVVLALAGGVAVVDARRDGALARVRSAAGVVRETVEPPLESVEWGTPETVSVLYAPLRSVDGLLVGPTSPTPGVPPAVVGLDPATGTELWRVDLGDAPREGAVGVSCTGDADPARTAWCLVADDGERRMVGVDLVHRSVRTTLPVPDGTDARVIGDTLVVLRGTSGGVEVVATDLADGTRQWLTRLPDPAAQDEQAPVFAGAAADPGALLPVWSGSQQWWVDPADGAVRANRQDVTAVRGGRLAESVGEDVTRLLGAGDGPDVDLPGTPLSVYPDDGSAPDVLVAARQSGGRPVVRGVDVRGGAVLWERPQAGVTWPSVLLLDGVVYGVEEGTVWAVDAVTGHQRWSADLGAEDLVSLQTDGLHLLRVATTPDGLEVEAFDLRDGSPVWTQPVPEGLQWLAELSGLLVGSGADGRVHVVR